MYKSTVIVEDDYRSLLPLLAVANGVCSLPTPAPVSPGNLRGERIVADG
jgi:hypothetical protein